MASAHWRNELKSQLIEMIVPKLEEWSNIVDTFGLSASQRLHWVEQVKEATQMHFQGLVDETLEEREKVSEEMRQLLSMGKQFCEQLAIEFPSIDSTHNLYEDRNVLQEHLNKWKDMISSRRLAIISVQKRLNDLCTILGKSIYTLSVNPLLSEFELQNYTDLCNDLAHEKQKRLEEFQSLRNELCEVVVEMGYKPKIAADKAIVDCNGDVDNFLSADGMDRVRRLHQTMIAMKAGIIDDLAKHREQLESLWSDLEVDVQYTNDFIKTHCEVNCRTLDAFAGELARCNELRRANLKTFVEKLRKQLVELWDEGGFSMGQRDEFRDRMEDTFFTEDLLTLHDLQINNVKKYLAENKQIFELLKKYRQMHEQRKDLEVKANGPNRFKNRGGTLLEEEKQRNNLIKSIPATEAALLKAAEKFELKNDSPFLYHGQTIASIVETARKTHEQEKQQLLSERRRKRDITLSGTKISQMSRLTPREDKSAKKLPKSAPTHNILRGRKSFSKAKIRLSFNKKTPRKCTPAKVLKHLQNAVTEYGAFENGLSERSDSRSTINSQAAHSSQLNPIIRIDSPKSVDCQLRVKPTNLDLLF